MPSHKPTMDSLVEDILFTEKLEKCQTPFRIENQAMARWERMQGFELNPDAQKPYSRRNFLYLRNCSDIHGLVKSQLNRYIKRNPDITIDQMVHIFDQSNPNGKIEYLTQQGYRMKTKMRELIQ